MLQFVILQFTFGKQCAASNTISLKTKPEAISKSTLQKRKKIAALLFARMIFGVNANAFHDQNNKTTGETGTETQ